jgi:hypothetical protein
MTHNDNHHCEFHKAYARIFESLYIRHMIKRLRRYIHHCKSCLERQTKRHSSYDELNSIRTMTLSFHTVIIDFVIVLSMTLIEENAILTITNKFFKRISIITKKNTWNVFEWARAWLNALQRKNWRISRAIIFDRDSKFLEAFWNIIFRHMNVALHFTIVYHSSTDDQSERTNQTIEIAIRFSLMKNQISDFTKLLFFIQTFMNNVSNVSIELFSNEILYEFKVTKFLNLLNDTNAINAKDDESLTFLKKERIILRNEAENAIAFANAAMKIRLDFIRKSLNLNVKNFVYLKLHKEFTQLDLTNRKFSKQRLESVKILKKIEKLVYKLDISTIWKIHSIIFVIHLKSDSGIDFYDKETKESESVKNAQEKIKNVYEIERILAKRFIKIKRARHSKIQYRVKWLEWDDHHNQWIDATEMKNAQNLVNELNEISSHRMRTSNDIIYSHSNSLHFALLSRHYLHQSKSLAIRIKFVAHFFS